MQYDESCFQCQITHNTLSNQDVDAYSLRYLIPSVFFILVFLLFFSFGNKYSIIKWYKFNDLFMYIKNLLLFETLVYFIVV